MTKLASLIPPAGISKYEVAIVAAREARRINECAHQSGQTVTGKPTVTALERTIRGEVPYGYEEQLG